LQNRERRDVPKRDIVAVRRTVADDLFNNLVGGEQQPNTHAETRSFPVNDKPEPGRRIGNDA
jgi:hypothetical protein